MSMWLLSPVGSAGGDTSGGLSATVEYIGESSDIVNFDTDAFVSMCSHTSTHYTLPTFIQRQVFSALSQISKHSLELAEMVVEADVFPAVLMELKGQQSCDIV